MPKDLAMRPDLADSPLSATEAARRTAAAAALLEGYAPPAGFYDELLDEQQQPRPTWCDLLASLGELGAEGVEQREEQLRRIIQDNGITYNVYGDTSKAARPWTMDIVPRLLEHAECEFLEAGLGQRAQLFNLILQDVYGPQRLLKEGLLPPMVILGNPRFLRPCHRLLPEKVAHLHLFASDLARAPDGHWWVVNDRLDAASGLGYTLENRIISSRVLPEIFHRYGVRRLQPFLQRLTDSYERLAPKPLGEPLVVFLTQGPANETYFDQSYLARLLGFLLVEGADLTVRSNRVYLKTIAGME
ncbi:MAG: circularly permuted type 2 ATP-grasp protein, partial [Opitutales bacterium]